jgi:phosphotransferase system HPr-like phosphotransfer protein
MTEASIDRIIPEERFAASLSKEADTFFQLANTVRKQGPEGNRRGLIHQLGIEADSVEAYLDDHGAKNNESYYFFRELVASVRGFASVGFVLSHLRHRLRSYDTEIVEGGEEALACRASLTRAREFVGQSTVDLLDACHAEAVSLGVVWHEKTVSEESDFSGPVNLRLPHNLGEEVIEEEDRKVAEVASKYLQVCGMFSQSGIESIQDPAKRRAFLEKVCTEARARVYEATVHNLQSTYDTYIKGSSHERDDSRVARLRGHASAAFHFLEAVTCLTHFVERHESQTRHTTSSGRMAKILSRDKVEEVLLNDLLVWAQRLVVSGEGLAREILNTFSQIREVELTIPDGVVIHARPASLIVAIVNYHEMPVELGIDGKLCNAASILDVLICAGSNPEAKTYIFRGDSRPLADLEALFAARLGEEGLEQLPEHLSYLIREV